MALLLVLHAALAVWGATRNSVTFDENFHLPAGVMILRRGDFTGSVAQPPLAKVLYALPALALGARPPTEAAMASGDEGTVGESFMRVNAARYHRLYFAARLVGVAFSLLLGLLVWRWARALYGEAAGLLALALYALAPESLAHAGSVGTDLPTALAFTASLYAFWRLINGGGWRAWAWTALAVAAAFLVRFSAVQFVVVFVLVVLLAQVTGRLERPGRMWLGLVLLAPLAWVAINAGYLFTTYWGPWGALPFRSRAFHGLAQLWPGLRIPLPEAYLGGLDYMSLLGEPERVHTFLLGKVFVGSVWYYFPLALLFKAPLGLWGAVGMRAVARPRGARVAGVPAEWLLGIAAAVTLVFAMFFTRYNFGVRYLLPLLPLACVWCGGLLAAERVVRARRAVRAVAVALAVLLAVESLAAAPWWLSFFNRSSGGPARGWRVLNDSNVDWGQGLIALREELARRGIARVHLAYHGTTDPAMYGIDYVPYFGGTPGPESDWLAVSSYYFVGLPQRMMTSRGRTPPVRLDFRALWDRPWAAQPARCMFLYRIR
ncbi:MAG: glycosyltransferase family 39 protein [Candidatus Eisenbacteria bacterium]|nr:glycosyltransferase family 39 protein [Candidatus Eisenbacteria bacterium]